MMKSSASAIYILTYILILSSCIATIPSKPVEIVEMREVPGLSKEQIFNKTRQWFSQYFVSGKSVIDYENANEGTIIGNGIAVLSPGMIEERINYNIKVDTKEGRFRVTATILKHTNKDSSSIYTVVNLTQERIDNANRKVAETVSSLESYIMGNTGNKSDW